MTFKLKLNQKSNIIWIQVEVTIFKPRLHSSDLVSIVELKQVRRPLVTLTCACARFRSGGSLKVLDFSVTVGLVTQNPTKTADKRLKYSSSINGGKG